MNKDQLNLTEISPYYKIKMLKSRVQNGLLILTIQNALMRLGFDIDPFVVTQEKIDYCSKPKMRDGMGDYIFRELNVDEIQKHYETIGMDSCTLDSLLSSNHMAFGLFFKNQLAAYMMARFTDYTFKSEGFTLEKDEAYMCGAYTYDAFRGKGLAPFLRYRCYEVLCARGYTNFLSITQYFNKSSLKYKAKLNAKFKAIYLYVEFFHSYSRLFSLKTYKIKD